MKTTSILLIFVSLILVELILGCAQESNIMVFVGDNKINSVQFGQPPAAIATGGGSEMLNLMVYSDSNELICNTNKGNVGNNDVYVFGCDLSGKFNNEHPINITVVLTKDNSVLDVYSKIFNKG